MNRQNKCSECQGYGFWPVGILCSIGESDAREWGNKVVKCPWCGASHDDKSERYNTLARIREEQK